MKVQKLLFAFIVLLLSWGCWRAAEAIAPTKEGGEQGTEQQADGAFPLTVTDTLARKPRLKEPQELSPLFRYKRLAIGLGEKWSASEWDNYPEEVLEIDRWRHEF